MVRAENKTQCKRSRAENCECGELKYRISSKEYYRQLKNAEQRPSGTKLMDTIKLPSQAKLSGREKLSSREKMDHFGNCPAPRRAKMSNGAKVPSAVNKTTSQNLWPRINSNEFINSAVLKNRAERSFFLTLVARWREHFRVFLEIFLVAQLSPKRGVLVYKNSLASCQQCCHSVEPRALTCPFKHSDLIAWSLLIGHPTHKYL